MAEKTNEQIAIENEAAAETTAEAETVAAEAEAEAAAVEERTEENLKKVFITHEPLDKPAESDSETDEPSPEEEKTSAESDVSEAGPTPAEAVEEKKILAEQAAEKAAEEAAVAGEEATAVTDEKSKATDEEAGKAKEQEDVPQLSEAYCRAAIHRGWKDEEIKEFFVANPELATKTFANIYEDVNRSSREYAKFGQASIEAAAKLAEKPEPGEQTTSEYKSAVDIEKLRKDNPGDPMVDLIEAQDAQNKLMFEKLNTLEAPAPASADVRTGTSTATEQRAANQEVALIQQQIDGFFNSEETKPYAEFYGVVSKDAADWGKLTPGERANRWAVIDMMDQMIAGAESFGQVMEIDEAMRRAHLSVSEPLREKVIREGIMGKVEKRSHAMTLKPSSTAKSDTATAPRTQEELVEVTGKRLSKLFH